MNNIAPRLAERDGLPLAVAKDMASGAFDGLSIVQEYNAAVRHMRLRYWQQHPDELRTAAEAGVDLYAAERELLTAEASR